MLGLLSDHKWRCKVLQRLTIRNIFIAFCRNSTYLHFVIIIIYCIFVIIKDAVDKPVTLISSREIYPLI